jgi:pyruvate dehydrogenase E2 component (dihydrolipoamide acetyltransferase)
MSSVAQAAQRVPMGRLRRIIGARMRESVTTKPQVTLHTCAPADRLIASVRARSIDRRVGLTALLAHTAVQSLVAHPSCNGHISQDAVTSFAEVNLGIAVDTPAGLMVPVLRDAHQLDDAAIASAIERLADRARDGTLAPAETFDATFTISTLGAYGIEQFTPIINPPQIAMLGIGAVRHVLVLEDGRAVERAVIHLSLSFDHAAIAAPPAARFLADLVTRISAPMPLQESQ